MLVEVRLHLTRCHAELRHVCTARDRLGIRHAGIFGVRLRGLTERLSRRRTPQVGRGDAPCGSASCRLRFCCSLRAPRGWLINDIHLVDIEGAPPDSLEKSVESISLLVSRVAGHLPLLRMPEGTTRSLRHLSSHTGAGGLRERARWARPAPPSRTAG
eukprot:scaffold90531_cov30-Tisochrysis_lutea.AAC.2